MSFLSSIVFNSLKSSVNLLKMQQIYKQEEFLRSPVDKKPSKNNFEEEEKLNPDNSAKRFQYENYELNSSIVQLDPGPTEKPEKVAGSKVSPLKSLNNLNIQHHFNNPKAGKNPQCSEIDRHYNQLKISSQLGKSIFSSGTPPDNSIDSRVRDSF